MFLIFFCFFFFFLFFFFNSLHSGRSKVTRGTVGRDVHQSFGVCKVNLATPNVAIIILSYGHTPTHSHTLPERIPAAHISTQGTICLCMIREIVCIADCWTPGGAPRGPTASSEATPPSSSSPTSSTSSSRSLPSFLSPLRTRIAHHNPRQLAHDVIQRGQAPVFFREHRVGGL